MTHIRNHATNRPLCGADGPMGSPSDCPDCDMAATVPPELSPWAYGDEPPDDDWHDTEAGMWGDDPEPLQTSDTEDTEDEHV